MSDYLQATATVLSLINPAVAATIFKRLESGRTQRDQISDATKAALAISVVLVGAALIGARVLDLFGISMDAFRVAGGAVLAWMGFAMLLPSSSSGSKDDHHDQAPKDGGSSLAPLILFAASPGTITGVITLSVAHTGTELPVTTLVAIAVAVLLTWILLLVSTRGGSDKQGLAHDLVPKFMGLIVLAMGVQFALGGLKSFMAAG